MIEIASSEVARLVNSIDPCWKEECEIVEDIKTSLHAINVCFQPPECNVTAYGIA